QNRRCVQVIHGAIKETLNLGGVQVHCQNAIGPGLGDQVGDQFGRDRNTTHVFAILTGVAVVRHDGGDPRGTRSFASVDHDQQFHQVLVDRRTGGLNQEHVASTYVGIEADGDFSVGEVIEID